MRKIAHKLAGVKNDKEFYELFPDQASFMKKHGKAFKKAQDGISTETLQKLALSSTAPGKERRRANRKIGKPLSRRERKDLPTYDYDSRNGLQFQEGAELKGASANRAAFAKSSKQARSETAKDTMNKNMGDFYKHPLTQLPGSIYAGIPGSKVAQAAARGFGEVLATPTYQYSTKSANKVMNPELMGKFNLMNATSTIGEDIAAYSGVGASLSVIDNVRRNKHNKDNNKYSSHPSRADIKQDGDIVAADGLMDKMGGAAGVAGMAGQAVDIYSTIKGNADKVDSSVQQRRMSDLDVRAGALKPDIAERQYVNPTDIQNTGEEFFPIYGVGTNVLSAQDGGSIRSRLPVGQNYLEQIASGNIPQQSQAMQIQQQYAGTPEPNLEQIGNQKGAPSPNKFAQWMGKQGRAGTTNADGSVNQAEQNNGEVIGESISKIGGVFNVGDQQESGYGKMGKLVGETAGKFIPIPGAGAVLGAGLELVGTALDPQLKEMKKNQNIIQNNTTKMQGFGATAANTGFAQDGTEISGDLDGNLQILDDGEARTISTNKYLPGTGQTVEFNKGDLHTSKPGSGIEVELGGQGALLEKGETATMVEDGNGEVKFQVDGNLTIPKGYEGAGTKFKNYAKLLSVKEEKSNKVIAKNTEAKQSLEVRSKFDALKEKSLDLNIKGHEDQLKEYAYERIDKGTLQKSIKEAAGDKYSANSLAKGKLEIDDKFVASNMSRDGLEMYQDGNLTEKQRAVVAKRKADREAKISQGYKEEKWFEGTEGTTRVIPGAGVKDKDNYDGEGGYASNEDWAAFLKTPKGQAYTAKHSGNGRGNLTPITVEQPGMVDMYKWNKEPEMRGIPVTNPNADTTTEDDNSGLGWADAVNSILPYARPSDKDKFDRNQIAGEMYALTHNQLDPVQAQKFTPQLDVPYDISLQDQRNSVVSSTNAGRRMTAHNTAQTANLSSQEYQAINKVNAEEFRMNQGKKDQVYTGNRATMNAANMTNLGILDKQYERQTQAKSKTKETTQVALNSISSKYQQHKLENKTLGTYENLYNYRFGANDRAQNYNPLARFNTELKNGTYSDKTPKEIAALKKGAIEATRGASSTVAQNGARFKVPLTKALKITN